MDNNIIVSFDKNMRNCKNLKENIYELDDFNKFTSFIEKLQSEKLNTIKGNASFNYEELKNFNIKGVNSKVIVSLRASKKYRVYGYFVDNTFYISKLDKNHLDT